MPVKSRSPFVVYLRQNKSDIFTHEVENFNTDTDLPTVRFPYTLDLPETPDLSSSLNICPTVVENSTMKLKVKRTARKTITKLVSKPLIIEVTANQEEMKKAGSGATSDFSVNVNESSPSEKAKDVNDSSSTSGSDFSWKKKFVMYKEEISDSGQSDSVKLHFLRPGPSEKDDAVTASSGSLFSRGDDFELNKETILQAEEPHFESSASSASGVSLPHKITSDLCSKSDDFELSKEITVQAEEPHVESPESNTSGTSTTLKITSDSLEVENLPPTDFGLQKKDDSRKSVAGKEGKGTTTAIQEVPEGDKQGCGRPPKITLKCSDLEIPSSSDSQLQKRNKLRKLIESKEEKRASTSIQEVPKVSKQCRGRPPKVTSKNSEPEISSLNDSGMRKKDNLKKSVGSKEGKSTSIQKVPESCKRGRGRPRKQSSVDYSNKTIKKTVDDEILLSSESANFAPLEKNVSIVLKRLTNAELKKYNVEDQLKICLNQGMIGKNFNIYGVSRDRNLTVANPTEESELSVVSDTEIQDANSKKENLKENVQKWLQTVVIVHCVDNLEENMSDQSVVKDAGTITQSAVNHERRKTPKELNDRKIIAEPSSNNLSPSQEVVSNGENSVDLVLKCSDSEVELVPVERRGRKRKNTLTPIVRDQETASRSSSISSSRKKKKSRNFLKESIENPENDEDFVFKKSDRTKKLECIEQHGRKRKILRANPVAGRQNSVISSVHGSTSKYNVSKRLSSKPVKNDSDEDLGSCSGTIVKSITSNRDKKTSAKKDFSSSKKDIPKRPGRKGKVPLSATSSVKNMSGRRSRASSRVIPPALSEDMKKLYCNVEMPDATHTNITVGTLFDMYDMSPVVRIDRIEPDYLEYLLSVL